MVTKLTLSMESAVIEEAKAYAYRSGRSLSEIVESYLKRLVNEEDQVSVLEDLRSIYGSVKLPDDLDEKKAIRDIASKKHKK